MLARSRLPDNRTDRQFIPEVYEGIDAVVPLSDIGVDLPLAEVIDSPRPRDFCRWLLQSEQLKTECSHGDNHS